MATTWQYISKSILSSNTTTVSFTSIPQTYDDLVLVASPRSDVGGQGDGWAIYINGNAPVTGIRSGAYADGTSASLNTDAGGNVLLSSGNAWTANTFGATYVHFPQYTQSKQRVGSVHTFWGGGNNTSGRGLLVQLSGWHLGTSAITSFTIQNPDSGGTNMMTGSSFYLYGIKNS